MSDTYTDLVPNLPRKIAERMAIVLRNRLSLGEDNCYVTSFMFLPAGAPDTLVIQIVPGGATAWSGVAGNGGQDGGNLFRLQTYTLAHFFTFDFDQKGQSQEAMIRQGEGIIDTVEKTWTLFSNTTLGFFQVPRSALYISESPIMVSDEEDGKYRKDLVISIPYVTPAGNGPPSLTESDWQQL